MATEDLHGGGGSCSYLAWDVWSLAISRKTSKRSRNVYAHCAFFVRFLPVAARGCLPPHVQDGVAVGRAPQAGLTVYCPTHTSTDLAHNKHRRIRGSLISLKFTKQPYAPEKYYLFCYPRK